MSKENRLPPETRGDFTRCCICFEFTRAINWHHTVPQAVGGEDSLQIPLDADCHSTLHSKADAIVAYLVGNRKDPVGRYWDNEESEERAETWLRILVEALLEPPISSDDKKVRLGAPKVDMETRSELALLKQDLPGVTNLMQVLQYCIHFTLHNKGYKDGKTNNNASTGKRSNDWTSNMRTMRGTKRRKFDKR